MQHCNLVGHPHCITRMHGAQFPLLHESTRTTISVTNASKKRCSRTKCHGQKRQLQFVCFLSIRNPPEHFIEAVKIMITVTANVVDNGPASASALCDAPFAVQP
jgi:hypothetical protein